MEESIKSELGYPNSSQELRQLIIDNPELPLLVFAGEDANIGEYSYTVCSYVDVHIGEFLDCVQPVNPNQCYTDRDSFEEDLEEYLADTVIGSKEVWEAEVEKAITEYEPYWKKCIIVYVDN